MKPQLLRIDNETEYRRRFSKLSQGKTVIMIAHRLSTVAGADRIYVVKDGQIAESGSSRELMERRRSVRPDVAELSDFRSVEGPKGGTVR